jgi:hypothetical protein
MFFSNDIMFALLLSVIATGTNTDLFTNTNFLLLMLLSLSCCNQQRPDPCCQPSSPRLFG